MKVGLLVVVAVLVATPALLLRSCAKPQEQKREAQVVHEPTPAPSSESAAHEDEPAPSSSDDPRWWYDRSIRNVEDARQFFGAIDGSHFIMMKGFTDRRDEYAALKIDKATESRWRRGMIARLSGRLLDPATDAGELWRLYSRLETVCEWQDDPDSVLKIYEVTRRIADRLPVEDGIIVAEGIIGRGAYTYETGLIYNASKHGLKDVAQDLSDHALSLAQRAKNRNVDAERAEGAIEKCLEVKKHFGLR